jgi:hypothetical protein
MVAGKGECHGKARREIVNSRQKPGEIHKYLILIYKRNNRS